MVDATYLRNPDPPNRAQNLEGLYLMGFEAGKVRAHPRYIRTTRTRTTRTRTTAHARLVTEICN
jgi:hypothetical protein